MQKQLEHHRRRQKVQHTTMGKLATPCEQPYDQCFRSHRPQVCPEVRREGDAGFRGEGWLDGRRFAVRLDLAMRTAELREV